MALLDLQSLEIPQGHGGGGGDVSSASLLLCDTNSHGSVLLCL